VAEFSIMQAAQRLRVHPDTVRRHIKRGRLYARRIKGGKILVTLPYDFDEGGPPPPYGPTPFSESTRRVLWTHAGEANQVPPSGTDVPSRAELVQLRNSHLAIVEGRLDDLAAVLAKVSQQVELVLDVALRLLESHGKQASS
jgi:excisionase family DNA binding protein